MVTTTKPDWVVHTGEKKNKCTIYSISVHPDGTRLATGGQDNKVKIWSTLPILDQEEQNNENSHRLLCTMSAHVGPVLTVRWAHHGRFLATGSDDKVVMIWNLDASGGGRLWGSDEVNVENWKPLKRLSAHDADVVDVAWSRDDSMLASVGLDSVVNIWSGYTFERLRTLSGHVGFVKGVTWDPVGEFLATQSDDKTVKVWSTQGWSVVNTVSKPFERSPQSTFFRRLSWSPDGAFIAASNAMCGPVFVAAVIEREGWNSDISFIGHQNTIQVAAFNPRLFFAAGSEPGRATASTVLALGADDFNISIWRNTLHKPMMVIKDVFTRELHDLCWSNDGLVLYGCSADGSICAIQFRPEELPELAQFEATDLILEEYGFKPSIARPVPLPPADFQTASSGEERVNTLVPRKGKARRVGLSNGNGSTSHSNGNSIPQSRQGGAVDLFAAASSSRFSNATTDGVAEMLGNRHMAFANGDSVNQLASRPLKRKATGDDGGRAPKGKSMGVAASDAQAQDIRAPRVTVHTMSGARVLDVPRVQTILRVAQMETQTPGQLVAENAADDRSFNKLTFTRSSGESWVYVSTSAALAIVATANFCAAAYEDRTVKVYSVEGQQRATLRLPAPCHALDGSKDMLLVLTADCLVRVIDTKTSRAFAQVAEIVDEYTGPLYQHAAARNWQSTVLGVSKRDVARALLDVCVSQGRGEAIADWANGKLDVLDRAAAEEAEFTAGRR
ncbi:HIR complex subunit [Cryptotrichosporon argae]